MFDVGHSTADSGSHRVCENLTCVNAPSKPTRDDENIGAKVQASFIGSASVSGAAWIVVDIGALDWCKLSYQFGHELGHVLCNSWQRQAKPKLPSQWVEEALVEAFSIRGLGLLADSWEQRPPFPNDAAFANNIRKYRQDLIEKYRKSAGEPRQLDMCAWLRRNRDALDHTGGVGTIEGPEIGPEILQILAELEGDKACVEDLSAVNRWPARSEVPVEDYLRLWQTSCAEIDAPGRLPARLAQSFRPG